ncbi:MAG: formylglycine-generating enzyme family protein [Bacteroidia bacterium]|nr:formylglycine-generating enzyme family protein [Bacteroidia bacterium]
MNPKIYAQHLAELPALRQALRLNPNSQKYEALIRCLEYVCPAAPDDAVERLQAELAAARQAYDYWKLRELADTSPRQEAELLSNALFVKPGDPEATWKLEEATRTGWQRYGKWALAISIVLILVAALISLYLGTSRPVMDVVSDTTNKIVYPFVEPVMVQVPGGTFSMGTKTGDEDARPVHAVTLEPFELSETEVTQAQWQALMPHNPSHFVGCDACPVENVSWEDIREYITRLNARTGHTYRLPTEAEWEYAAGGQATRTDWAGTHERRQLRRYAWTNDNADHKTHPVRQLQPNDLSLYDMSGNVWEWCSDRYGVYTATPQVAPKGASTHPDHVIRGGSWYHPPSSSMVTNRYHLPASSRLDNLGFRLAR